MKNKQIYQTKSALYLIACLGVLLLINPFCSGPQAKKQPKTPSVVNPHNYERP